MGEDSFFEALFQIMWNMDTDIFFEEERTLALLADLVPKCKKQRKRIKAMYDCGTMDSIEKAVANKEYFEIYLKRAVRQLISAIGISSEKAIFAVNEIIFLWDGELPMLESYDENENLDDIPENNVTLSDDDFDINDLLLFEEDNKKESTEKNSPKKTEVRKTQSRRKKNNNNKNGGEENMIFLQDVATDDGNQNQDQNQDQNQEQQQPAEGDSGGGEAPPEEAPPADSGSGEPKESLIKKLVQNWCRNDVEDGRPYMATCPIGWILMLLCSAIGVYMVAEIHLGDKMVIPTFAFMFTVLTSKRLYRYESSGRFSILVAVFYLAAMGRAIWLGHPDFRFLCIAVVFAALIIFNSGRMASWLDESKKRSFSAYSLIIFLSALVTAGAYVVQHIPL